MTNDAFLVPGWTLHGKMERLLCAAWLAALFIQPFEKFAALKYVFMAIMLAILPILLSQAAFRLRLRAGAGVLAAGLGVVIWCLVTALLSPYVADSLHALLRDLVLQTELLLVGVLLVRDVRQARWGLLAMIAGFAAVSFLSSMEVTAYLKDHALSEGQIPRSHRSFWGGYASLASFSLPLVIAYAVAVAATRRERWFLSLLTAGAVILTGLYGSRSPLLVIAAAVIVLLVLMRSWKVLGVVVLVITLGVSAVAFQRDLGYLEKYRSLAQSQTYVTNAGLSLRLDVWTGLLEVIAARPLLGYGYGWKKLAWVINDGGYATRWKAGDPGKTAYFLGDEETASYGKVNPHNYFLQVVFEIGLPGLLLVLVFWLAVIRNGWCGLRRGRIAYRGVRVAILTTLLAYFLSNLANGYWVGGLANMALALSGILVGLSVTERQQKDGA